jgi:hypothetical protein
VRGVMRSANSATTESNRAASAEPHDSTIIESIQDDLN